MNILQILGKEFTNKKGNKITISKYEVSYIGAHCAGEPTAHANVSLVYTEEVPTLNGGTVTIKSHTNNILWHNEREKFNHEETVENLLNNLVKDLGNQT